MSMEPKVFFKTPHVGREGGTLLSHTLLTLGTSVPIHYQKEGLSWAQRQADKKEEHLCLMVLAAGETAHVP